MADVRDILADLIAFKTDGDENGIRKCIDYICAILEKNGILYARLRHAGSNKESIIAALNVRELKNIKGGLILSGHIDTVGANEKEWQVPPFQPTAAEGLLWGRGTVDMKYFAAVVLHEPGELKKAGFPIILTFTSDEETDVCGIREIISFMKKNDIAPQYALIGEPTGFRVCVANKGFAGYRTLIKGKAGHSSRPDLGVNANYIAAKMITFIEKLNAQYMPLGTTLNVGVIGGGKERNSISDEAYIDWEMRYIEAEHKDFILTQMEAFCQELSREYAGASVTTEAFETLPAFVRMENSRLAETALSLLNTEKLSLPYATEAGFFQEAGIETFICGAGDEALAHTAEERIAETDLGKYTGFLRNLISRLSCEFIRAI